MCPSKKVKPALQASISGEVSVLLTILARGRYG